MALLKKEKDLQGIEKFSTTVANSSEIKRSPLSLRPSFLLPLLSRAPLRSSSRLDRLKAIEEKGDIKKEREAAAHDASSSSRSGHTTARDFVRLSPSSSPSFPLF